MDLIPVNSEKKFEIIGKVVDIIKRLEV
jgi:SOS-response transcriptional repressor LexA